MLQSNVNDEVSAAPMVVDMEALRDALEIGHRRLVARMMVVTAADYLNGDEEMRKDVIEWLDSTPDTADVPFSLSMERINLDPELVRQQLLKNPKTISAAFEQYYRDLSDPRPEQASPRRFASDTEITGSSMRSSFAVVDEDFKKFLDSHSFGAAKYLDDIDNDEGLDSFSMGQR